MNNQYQQRVEDWVKNLKAGYWDHSWITNRLSEENGELAREVGHKYGPKRKKPDEKPGSILEEAGDMFFTLICLLNKEGLSLDDAFNMAMDKAHGRDKDRWEKKGCPSCSSLDPATGSCQICGQMICTSGCLVDHLTKHQKERISMPEECDHPSVDGYDGPCRACGDE